MTTMKSALLSVTILVMVLVSCQPNATTPLPGVSPQPFVTLSPTGSPSASATASSTPQIRYPRPPVPTISLATQLKIVELLNTKNCILPCYLGITPGVTRWSDAKTLLDSSGAVNTGPGHKEGDVTWFDYAMHGSYSINTLNQPGDSGNDNLSYFDLLLAVDSNGIVQKMFAWFLSHDAGHIFPEYWTKNSPRNIFLQIGMPDAIYSTTSGAGLALVYEKLGVVGIYDALLSQNFLCPENDTRLSDMSFTLTNTTFPLDIHSPEQNVTQEPWLWLPIEQTLNVSVQQFYDKVLSDSSACFELRP
jgi:hypothetical protein